MYIGSNSSVEQANGLIDDLRISNIARTDAEILADYNSGAALPVDDYTTAKLNFDGDTLAEGSQKHNGDMWYAVTAKLLKRYNGTTNEWELVEDQKAIDAYANAAAAQDTADGKRRVFIAEPTTPYDVGDLWAGGTTADLKKCKTQRLTGAYNAADWELATNAVAQDTQYNKVKITTSNGVQVLDASNTERVKMGQIDTEYGIKATHTDNSYTQMTETGFKRYVAGTGYNYNYLTYVGAGSTTGGGHNIATDVVTVTLPSDFQGKDFKVNVAMQNWNGLYYANTKLSKLKCTVVSVNTASGTFTVDAYAGEYIDIGDYYYTTMDFTYFAQY
jgi:hypothetical protein